MHALIHLLMVMDVLSILKNKNDYVIRKIYVLSSEFDSCTRKMTTCMVVHLKKYKFIFYFGLFG